MNAHSSRSHLIFSILIKTKNLTTGPETLGKLTLVDLAGSERGAKSGATAERLTEATSINKSLTALGNVVHALTSKADHIPYRESKLTRLLADSLGGNSKTLMFCNVAPNDFNVEESVISLTYASRVKTVTNGAASKTVSNSVSAAEEVKKMKKVIQHLTGVKKFDLDALLADAGDADEKPTTRSTSSKQTK